MASVAANPGRARSRPRATPLASVAAAIERPRGHRQRMAPTPINPTSEPAVRALSSAP